jgi:hypothetical protein
MPRKPNTRTVGPAKGGGWKVTKPGQKKPVSHHRKQSAGQAAARKELKKAGGGELITKNAKGTIRAKDTVAPGHDPRSRKG